VVAKACDDAAKRIEAAAGPMGQKEREELFAALARIEQLGDDVKRRLEKAKIGEISDIPGLRNPQMDRIESAQHALASKVDRIDARTNREPTIASLPIAAHVVLVVVMAACVAVGYYAHTLPPTPSYVILGAFALLAYLYLAPVIGPSVATALQKLGRVAK
jgi:hypothetical protein